ncbi:sulfurtransferase TusA family protein [Halocatena marina]|uniref:Sulfurtransferase TusA family protein n=1 Tax=Halocatena marina TaxID=2934937 RepID=A0ABD5YRW5_9EURY|nr:sulfurtransferase TusA family protein [Halocatena marina]
MTTHKTAEVLDTTGQNCPMPVVKTKQTIDQLEEGAILEVLATDPGSMSDLAGWAAATSDVELIEQDERSEIFTHYVRKTDS